MRPPGLNISLNGLFPHSMPRYWGYSPILMRVVGILQTINGRHSSKQNRDNASLHYPCFRIIIS
jgi:hypothetical protein